MCQFRGKTISDMERHILDTHVSKNKNNRYACDQCPFEVGTKNDLWGHYISQHKLDKDQTPDNCGNE